MPKRTADDLPAPLRLFRFHGVGLGTLNGTDQVTGECPWCGKDKLRVSVRDGRWTCNGCQSSGNPVQFLRRLHEESLPGTEGLQELADDRGLLEAATLDAWGVVRSILTRDWLVPGYGTGGRLDQLYRYAVAPSGKKLLLASPEYPDKSGRPVGAALFGVPLVDPKCETLYVCEGPWDGMALWEVLVAAGADAGSWGVVAVPGCGTFKEEWARSRLFTERKRVVILFDSDHSKRHPTTGTELGLAGYRGVRRTAVLLAAVGVKEIGYLEWGPDGYDPERPSGFDLRDYLGQAEDLTGRAELLAELLEGLVRPIPEEWLKAGAIPAGTARLEPMECGSWDALEAAWAKALRWRQGLGDVLSVMLAVALSTEQTGDQLFLQVIGSPGTGKTRFCDGMLVSKGCYPLEHLSGFHSGYTDASGEDFSLLARINRKTLITPEGDVMMSSPRFVEIMSQQRRIFDGTSGASYKNRKEDLRYTGLRTPWIIAGTQALMESDQSRLGDRFLRVCVDRPDEGEKDRILRRVGLGAWDAVARTSNCKADGQLGADMTTAFRLTGGYVDLLRREATGRLARVGLTDRDRFLKECADCADFTADFRARPNPDPRKDVADTKELPSRLMSQFVRLARCLAAVLGRGTADDPEVMRRVRKVARDTARGSPLEAARWMHASGKSGITAPALAVWLRVADEAKARNLLAFLVKIDVAVRFRPFGSNTRWSYRLTPRSERLFREVMREEEGADAPG